MIRAFDFFSKKGNFTYFLYANFIFKMVESVNFLSLSLNLIPEPKLRKVVITIMKFQFGGLLESFDIFGFSSINSVNEKLNSFRNKKLRAIRLNSSRARHTLLDK